MIEYIKYGILPGAFKPYHLGHHMVIQKMAKECDKAIVIISLCDRENVMGSDMAKIWRDHILDILPKNVETIFLESSPVNRLFEILRLREQNPLSKYRFSIYSDINDINKNYNDLLLKDICPTLLINGDVKRRGISRTDTTPISGTKMRQFIIDGDFESFEQFMPKELDNRAIFNILATIR